MNETAAVVFGELAVDNGKQQQWRPGASERLDMSSYPRHTISMLAGCCLMLAGSLAVAQAASDVDIAYEPCADSVRVSASDATLTFPARSSAVASRVPGLIMYARASSIWPAAANG